MEKKIKTPAELKKIVEKLKEEGKTVVLTNGCFDLLHIGHILTIHFAKQAGDVLIIGLNSDLSIKHLKGDSRPIIPEEHRALMLAALEDVDYVVIYNTLTPHNILKALKPDILVKGGTTGEIIGKEIVESYGGKIIKYEKVIEGVSTTAIIRRLLTI